jgi:hypothetical protein
MHDRADIRNLLAWQQAVAFNDRRPVGSVVALRNGEQVTVTAQAFVISPGNAYIICDGRQYRLSEIDDGTDANDKNNRNGPKS